jgi:stage II sporulation protein D
MITKEPKIKVGIIDGYSELGGKFNYEFTVDGVFSLRGGFRARAEEGKVILTNDLGKDIVKGREISCISSTTGTFSLHDVTIGKQFHWERREEQTFAGELILLAREGATLSAINVISMEEYLTSVISSEMSEAASMEFLKAHAITSRSWLTAMLERTEKARDAVSPASKNVKNENEVIRWYDYEEHDDFDVCADDHCQRYQGLAKIVSHRATEAVRATRGVFLMHENAICDARFYKACGGLTEDYENVWEDTPILYLSCVSDAPFSYPLIENERDALQWINSNPDAYCNVTDSIALHQILPSFDQETTDFFRWKVEYERGELEQILHMKSGIDFGTLHALVPIQRSRSGRIVKLRIEGSKHTLVVGKELEVRRWLSTTHLYSSAFIITTQRNQFNIPQRFILHGAGWGHGVGLCQVGAAMMAARGRSAEEILCHYFRGTDLAKLY